MASTIQIRVDDDLKKKSDNLFRELGTDTTTAIRMFLTQAVAYNGFPFEIKKTVQNPYLSLSEEQLLQKLETSRKHAEQGNYRDADDVVSDMREKYGIQSAYYIRCGVVDENLTVSAEEEFLRKEKIENLRKAIFKLRKKYRDVIVYRTYLQLSFKEISQVMGISESNAKVLYARGKEQIKRYL